MLVNEHAVLAQANAKPGCNQEFMTTQVTYSSCEYFDAAEISFPDFCESQYVPQVHLPTFHSPTSQYDFIPGSDNFQYGFILDHVQNHLTNWYNQN